MKLTVLSPEKTLLIAEVTAVEFPGTKGRFMVLKGHAPLLSSLTAGVISYDAQGEEDRKSLAIKGGFVEIKNDVIVVCTD